MEVKGIKLEFFRYTQYITSLGLDSLGIPTVWQPVPLIYFSSQLAGFSTAPLVSAVRLATLRTGRLRTLLLAWSWKRLTQLENSSFLQPLKRKNKQINNQKQTF